MRKFEQKSVNKNYFRGLRRNKLVHLCDSGGRTSSFDESPVVVDAVIGAETPVSLKFSLSF